MRNALTTKQSFWLGHIKAAQDEGIALAQYAKHNGLNVKALYNWRAILRGKGFLALAETKTNFIEAKVGKPTLTSSRLKLSTHSTVKLPNGVELNVAELDLPLLQWLASL